MEIRELTEEDIPSLLDLYVQLAEVNKNVTLEKARDVWAREIRENKNIKYFGALEKGKVVSTCYCTIIPNLTNAARPVCFVENVVTDKDYRKQGLGKKVIEKAIETAKKNNCYKVILFSGVARKEAHQFYENLGFSSKTKIAFDMRLTEEED
ncbi:MAG: GNAT family N-acetyltransferase [Treponema sp.]|nr:GNAT family N-acetyltransferase [Treponema sp.]